MEPKFVLEEKYINGEKAYEITQNLFSMSLLFSSFCYPDAKTCFFVEAFNFYQDLEPKVLYESFSQSITTYILQNMNKRHLITGEYVKNKSAELGSRMEMLGNYDYKNGNVTMYLFYFYKLRSFEQKDIKFLKSLFRLLEMDISNIAIVIKQGKIYLKLKREFILKQLVTGEYLKHVVNAKPIFQERISDECFILKEFLADRRLLKRKK